MRTWKKVGIFCILAAILLSGYGLPEAINAILDRQVNGNIETVNTETTQLQMSSDLTLTEKFLVMDRTTSSVNLNSAQNLEYEGACECLNQELSRLFPTSSFTLFSFKDFAEADHAITLFVYEEKSVLLWDFLLESEAGDKIRVLLDDDSGLILSFSYEHEETRADTEATDLFTLITDTGDTEPIEYLDDLAQRYVEYLRASYNLSGIEISYERSWDSINALTSDSDLSPDNEEEAADNSEFSATDSDHENTSVNYDMDSDHENTSEDSGTDSNNKDASEDSDASVNSTASGTAGNSSIWSFDADSQRADAANSLWDTDSSEKEASDSDSDEEVVIDEWHLYVHLTQNGEEYILNLDLDRSALSIHGLG
ncbi:MAG: MSCRAMM family adhesin SdrC [Lachnospiraceae bacterium]|nr:MSCRAMM family adhesin SdrC [Lachnospiraceae bacterium]